MSSTEAGGSNRPPTPPRVDCEAAAKRLLVALCVFAKKHPLEPIPARRLCRVAFGETSTPWSIETRRRRVREAIDLARQLLATRPYSVAVAALAPVPYLASDASPDAFTADKNQIAANGQGYWFTGDIQVLRWYADQRKKSGLKALASGSRLKGNLQAAAGQNSLFGTPAESPKSGPSNASLMPFEPPLKSEFRH